MTAIQTLESFNNNKFEVANVLKKIKGALSLLSENQLELALSWAAYVESHDIRHKSDFALLCADFLIDSTQFEASFHLEEEELYEVYDIISRKGLDQYI